ncbi:MAG TPA: ABC transporter substrate-binding protein [Chthonomonadales bacterium]|nr:ABC transporter substrate-binding protein [Chthonomonadales bacterium]
MSTSRVSRLRPRPIRHVAILILLLALAQDCALAQRVGRVTLQLPPRAGFDSAGYYVALFQGYYRDAGLDVRIEHTPAGSQPVDAVASGRAQYGVQGPSLLLARAERKPVVALAAIFQHSPHSLVVRADSGIGSPRDLSGKRVMMRPEEYPEIVAMLAARNITLSGVRLIRAHGGADDLIAQRADAVAGSATTLPFEAARRGEGVVALRPYRFGISSYGDSLFTTEAEIAERPGRVRAFLRATLQGWETAMANPEAAVAIMLRHHTVAASRTALLTEAQAMVDLVQPEFVDLGHMSRSRWRRTADLYVATGQVRPTFEIDGFLYSDYPPSPFGPAVRVGLAVGAAALLGLLAFLVINRRLGALVRARTAQLQGSEERLRNVIASIPGAVYRCEVHAPWRMDLLSEGFEALTGYAAGRFAGGGDHRFARIVAPDDLPLVEREVAAAVAEHRSFSIEYRIVRADGGIVWVHDEGRAVYDPSGAPTWLDGVFVDVTARAVAEEAARARSEEVDRFFDVSLDLLCFLDKDGRLRRVNPAWSRTLGYASQDLEGRLLVEFAHPDDVDAAGRAFAFLAAGHPVVGNTNRYRAADGSYRWLEWRAIPSGNAIYAAARDVTERKRVEGALDVAVQATYGATEREFFRDMVHHLAEALAVTQAHVAEIEEGSKEARTLAAWVDGRFAPEFTYALDTAPCQDAVASGYRHVVRGVADRYPRDAGLRQLGAESYFGTCLYDASGRPCGILAVVDRRPMEDSSLPEFLLRIFASRAAAEIGRLRAERERAALHDQLLQAQKMEAVGQLAGGIAHDFNNLLQVIGGFTELASDDVPADSPVRSRLAHVSRACERARDLVRQLLVFSRRQTPERAAVDANDLVGGALEMIERVLGEDIECRFQPGQGIPLVEVDQRQIEQVLLNLSVNARDAMPGGGRLEIETALRKLGPEACASRPWTREGDYVVLTVRDTGQGMTAEVRERVFEPFFTTKEVGQGTGLGLATAYGIVKQHEGLIDVESAPGRGSTFSVFLPAAPNASAPPAPSAVPAAPPPARGETVLVAEDDEVVCRLTVAMLENAGYTVVVARDGLQAVEAFEQRADQIDLVLVDIVMPGQSGRAVYDAVRRLRPDTPVLFASGYSYRVQEMADLDPSGIEVISKPYRSADLLERVRELLDRRAERPA